MPVTRGLIVLVATLCCVLSCTAFAQPQTPSLAYSNPVAIRYDSDMQGTINVAVHVWERDYAVPGTSLDQVRANLTAMRVGGSKGDFSAYTTWDLRWNLRYDESADSCSLRGATVEVDAVLTMPSLQDDAALSGDALEQWQGYVDALKDHELSHVQNEVDAANRLRDGFAALEPAGDCSSLAETITELGDQEKERIRQADVALDAETKHGALTGATFR